MRIGVLKEQFPGERRVALVPAHVPLLTRMGFTVGVQTKAGKEAGYTDEMYEARGATIMPKRGEVLSSADVVLCIRSGAADEDAGVKMLKATRKGAIVVGLMDPYAPHEAFEVMRKRLLTAFSLELVPRISRAQSVDVLSSMASVAGYKAVLIAADMSAKMFPMMITAAGTVSPAKVFVVGVGVAGLQAIATAKRLGASVSAYDLRAEVKEQVESLGAQFVSLTLDTGDTKAGGGYAKKMDEDFYKKQRELMKDVLAESDIVVTTAAVPGKKAPILIDKQMIAAMAPESIVIDLAAERGGNCALTKPGETVRKGGVSIVGPLNLASTIPNHASQMFSKNLCNFVQGIVKNKRIVIDTEDEVVRETLIAHEGLLRYKHIIPAEEKQEK